MNEISPSQKIKVFISSKCDNAGETPKYNPIRAELKELIENTKFATVYTFENQGASTLSAGSHYTYALEDSDVCIFLIDNADGIPSGVQAEVDVVRKKNKMALYYFCDETTTEKTELEKSLMGAKYAKSKTVHHFADLSKNSASALLDDITLIYHYYCTQRLIESDKENADITGKIDVQVIENHREFAFPKVILKNIDKCITYILKHTADYCFCRTVAFEQKIQTSDFDDWGAQFLSVLLEGKSIKSFNTSMFLDTLKTIQTPEYFNVVALRWKAIQLYFNGNIQECVNALNEALDLAKSTNQAMWVINDILIDLRNQHWELALLTNTISKSVAQSALDDNTDELYYPVLDRINESLQELYIQGLYKKKTVSPYSVELGSNINQLGELLASTYIIAMFNGSLTHLLLFFDKAKEFLFYLTNRYDDWGFKKNLLKFAIFNADSKEVKGVIDAYPEILMRLSAEDADSIISFCSMHPIEYKRQIRKLLAFGSIGYYLDDASFEKYEKEIVADIEKWLNDDNSVVYFGQYIFESLSGVSYRMSQDVLSEICCKFIDKQYSRWYIEMFKFMSKRMDLNKMSKDNAESLIAHIIAVMKSEKDGGQIKYATSFLSHFRRQNKAFTEELDKQISESLPNFYNFYYRIETTDSIEQDYPLFVNKLTAMVQQSNEMQGENGTYYGHGTRDIACITSILRGSEFNYTAEIMDILISTVADTIIKSKESVTIKLDAVLLLCCIAIKYPQDYLRNLKVYQSILEHENEIDMSSDPILFSNIDSLALRIGLKVLFSTMGTDVYADLMELLPFIMNDTATTISVTKFIADYLDINERFIIPRTTESVLLHNTFEWLLMDSTDVRWNATRILLSLSRNKDHADIINRKIIALIESDNVYIKNLILREVNDSHTISEEIKKRIFTICKDDANYVTRMVCKELNPSSAL